MAVPLPGKYQVMRRSRGLAAGVGEIVDSSTVSPLMLLALVRTRCLRRVGDLPAQAAPPPAPIVEPLPEPEPQPSPPLPRPAPKKWSKK